MNNEKHLKTIRRASRVGLWGSVGVTLATVLFLYASHYRFYQNEYTVRWMVIAGVVLAVLAVSMTLLNVRRQVPRLRQAEGLDAKLAGYATFVREVYTNMLVVVLLLCIFTALTARSPLLMLVIVCVLVLILNFPNIYKIKNDLGLNDEQMRSLFGDRYIA